MYNKLNNKEFISAFEAASLDRCLREKNIKQGKISKAL